MTSNVNIQALRDALALEPRDSPLAAQVIRAAASDLVRSLDEGLDHPTPGQLILPPELIDTEGRKLITLDSLEAWLTRYNRGSEARQIRAAAERGEIT